MTHTKVTYDDVEPVSEGLYFLRDPLDADNLGVSVLECEPGYTGMEHDHAEDGQEEVYRVYRRGRGDRHGRRRGRRDGGR